MKIKQVSKPLVVMLSLVMIVSLFAGLSITASAAETASTGCTEEGCDGTYENGFCTVCGKYEPCEGKGTDENPYLIKNAGQLYWFAQLVNNGTSQKSAKLTANIVINSGTFANDGTYTPGEGEAAGTTPRPWTPISSYGSSNTFDGDGYTISGLYYNSSANEYVGLFCQLVGTVKDLGIVNCYINTTHSDSQVGGVVGQNGGTVENCAVSGTVSGNLLAGGIVGWNVGNVTGCMSTGTVSGENFVGGVVAYNFATVTNCYSTSTVSGGVGSTIGGIVGNNQNTVTNCYGAGEVIGSADSTIGGVAGQNESTGTITNCYHLDTCASKGIGAGDGEATAMTADQFASGEVAALLGSSFGQNLGKDSAPTLGGTPVTNYGFYGQSLNIGASLSMKYYVTVFDEDLDTSKLEVEFTFLGEVKRVACEIDDETGLYVFTLTGITPQCMGENIKAVLKYEGKLKDTKATYSVEENLTNLLKDENLANTTKNLINDTLAYGKSVEKIVGYSSLKGNYEVRNNVEIKGENVKPSTPFISYTVRFGYLNTIKVKYQTDSLDLYINNVYTDHRNNSDGIYTAQIDSIAPTDFAKKNSFMLLSDGGTEAYTLELSINDYLYALSQSTTASEDEKALAQALYNYGLSAHIYSGNHSGGDGTETCQHGKQCTVCQAYYGPKAEHDYVYSATDFTITETCSYGCGHKATLTLAAPTDLIYDSDGKEATVSESGNFIGEYDLSYSQDGKPITTKPTDVGDGSHTYNYVARLSVLETDIGVNCSFMLKKAEATYVAPEAATGLIYTGDDLVLVSDLGSTECGTMKFRIGAEGEWVDEPNGYQAGTYTVYYKVVGDNNHNDSETNSFEVTIAKADPDVTRPVQDTFEVEYNDEGQLIGSGSVYGAADLHNVEYRIGEDGEWIDKLFLIDAGTYTIYYRYVVDEINYNPVDGGSFKVEITKVESSWLKCQAPNSSLTYNGQAQQLSVDVEVVGGTVKYSFDQVNWSEDFLYATDEGNHFVYIKIFGDKNHTDNTSVQRFNFFIDRKSLKFEDLTYNSALIWNGKAQLPTIKWRDITLVEGTDFTLNDTDVDRTNVGDITVTLDFIGNYQGNDVQLTFQIAKNPSTDEFDGPWIS